MSSSWLGLDLKLAKVHLVLLQGRSCIEFGLVGGTITIACISRSPIRLDQQLLLLVRIVAMLDVGALIAVDSNLVVRALRLLISLNLLEITDLAMVVEDRHRLLLHAVHLVYQR